MIVHFQIRKFYDSYTGLFERVDYWLRSNEGKIYFLINHIQKGEWVWTYKPGTDHSFIGNLPTFPDTSLMSEEELFQFSTVWDTIYGADEMDFEEVQLIQKRTTPLRTSTVNVDRFEIRIPEYELSYYSDEKE